jgi:hypothetical protein
VEQWVPRGVRIYRVPRGSKMRSAQGAVNRNHKCDAHGRTHDSGLSTCTMPVNEVPRASQAGNERSNEHPSKPSVPSPLKVNLSGGWIHHECLTVKLRGRAEAPDQSRGCRLSSRTRVDTTENHGPLQRLLGASLHIKSQLVLSEEITC